MVTSSASRGGLPWVLVWGPLGSLGSPANSPPARSHRQLCGDVCHSSTSQHVVIETHPLWLPLRRRNSHSIHSEVEGGAISKSGQRAEKQGLSGRNRRQASTVAPTLAWHMLSSVVPCGGSSETALACRSRVHGQTLGLLHQG